MEAISGDGSRIKGSVSSGIRDKFNLAICVSVQIASITHGEKEKETADRIRKRGMAADKRCNKTENSSDEWDAMEGMIRGVRQTKMVDKWIAWSSGKEMEDKAERDGDTAIRSSCFFHIPRICVLGSYLRKQGHTLVRAVWYWAIWGIPGLFDLLWEDISG